MKISLHFDLQAAGNGGTLVACAVRAENTRSPMGTITFARNNSVNPPRGRRQAALLVYDRRAGRPASSSIQGSLTAAFPANAQPAYVRPLETRLPLMKTSAPRPSEASRPIAARFLAGRNFPGAQGSAGSVAVPYLGGQEQIAVYFPRNRNVPICAGDHGRSSAR